MYENSRFLKNRFTFCGVNTNFGQQLAPAAYYHLTPIVSKGKHWITYLKYYSLEILNVYWWGKIFVCNISYITLIELLHQPSSAEHVH